MIEDIGYIREPQDGTDLALSIDGKIQYIAFTELQKAVEQHHAKAGAIVVLDVKTGEVLAMANLPTYNPNTRQGLTGAQLRNRVMTDTYEPGSTLKPFTVALAICPGRGILRVLLAEFHDRSGMRGQEVTLEKVRGVLRGRGGHR